MHLCIKMLIYLMHPRIKLQIVNFFLKNFILCETPKNEVRLQSFTQPESILMNILS